MKLVFTILIALFLLSCQDIEKMEKPKDLIGKQKMVEVLTDLSLLNSAKNYNKRFLEETGFKPGEFFYQKHNIDSLRLARSTRYYARNYNEFEAIYRQVQKNLEKLRDSLEQIQQKERDSLDSLRIMGKDSLLIDTTFEQMPTPTPDTIIISPYEIEKEIL